MGCICNKPLPTHKNGVLYGVYKSKIKPLDLIFVQGDGLISDVIKWCQKKSLDIPSRNDFSHVGMIVDSTILDDPNVLPGNLYIWESTVTSKLAGNVPDVEGSCYVGVQLRKLDLALLEYDQPNDTHIAIGHLLEAYRPKIDNVFKDVFTALFNQYNGARYDLNIYDLMASLYQSLRPCRNDIDLLIHSQKWLFCSELVSLIYRSLGILPSTVEPNNITPADFLIKGKMPIVVDLNITFIVTAIHSGIYSRDAYSN